MPSNRWSVSLKVCSNIGFPLLVRQEFFFFLLLLLKLLPLVYCVETYWDEEKGEELLKRLTYCIKYSKQFVKPGRSACRFVTHLPSEQNRVIQLPINIVFFFFLLRFFFSTLQKSGFAVLLVTKLW